MTSLESANRYRINNSVFYFIFSIWSFFILCRPQDYLPFLGYLRPGLVLGLVIFLLYLYNIFGSKQVCWSMQVKLYCFLFMVMIFSVPFSYYRRASFEDLINYGNVAMYFLAFSQLITQLVQLKRLLWYYTFGVAIYSLYILRFGVMLDGRISFGTMFDPNDIAFFIISILPFNCVFISKDNNIWIRILSLVNITIGLLVVLKTGSRGGLIALIAVICYLLFCRHNIMHLSMIKKIAMIVIAVASLQFVGMNVERYRSIVDLQSDYNVTGEEGRIAIWKIGARLMLTHPVTGIGFNRFPEGVGKDREARGLPSAKWHTAHNSLVQIGAETGVVGFLLFIVLSFNTFKILGLIANNSKSDELMKIGEIAKMGFIGHFVGAMFLSQAYSVYWAFYVALAAILLHIYGIDKTADTTL